MKKTIPFDLFREGETIYFNIIRLSELEKVLNKPIVDIVKTQDTGATFCLAGLQVGLKHHYPHANADTYGDMVDKFLEEGGTLDDIAIPIIRAIMASGIFGKDIAGKIDEKLETEGKNAKGTGKPSKA